MCFWCGGFWSGFCIGSRSIRFVGLVTYSILITLPQTRGNAPTIISIHFYLYPWMVDSRASHHMVATKEALSYLKP